MKSCSGDDRRPPGVYYARTDSGLELPIIDITHPAFAAAPPTPEETAVMLEQTVAMESRTNRLPRPARSCLMWLLSRRSLLMRGVRGASGTYLSGMNTYLLKLGPNNLGTIGAGKFDRAVASSLPALSARLRLQDLVRYMAEAIAPALGARPGRPLHCLNIAGGPCPDNLNLLLLLRKDRPGLLEGRTIRIHALDLESEGPHFAGRALDVLKAPGAPLSGLDVELVYAPYNWSETSVLRAYLTRLGLEEAVVAASSEGGLFDYGTNEEILANAGILRELTPQDAVLGGTITPADGPGGLFNRTSGATTIPRTLEEFAELMERSGWQVAKSVDRLMNCVVLLRKA